MSKYLDEALALMTESIKLSNTVKHDLLPHFTDEDTKEYLRFLMRHAENSTFVIPALKAGMGKGLIEFAENMIKEDDKKHE